MDKRTLKTIITELRDDFGLTYREIADVLESKYNVTRTTQAISALYKRHKKRLESDGENEIAIAGKLTEEDVVNIVNVYCITNNCKETQNMLKTIGYDIGYRKILDVVNNNEDYIKNISKSIVDRILREIEISLQNNIKLELDLNYKGIKASNSKVTLYVRDAIDIIIKKGIAGKIKDVFSVIEESEIEKYFLNKYDIK